MGTFVHTYDNYIIINDGSGNLGMPLSFFITQEPAYALPGGGVVEQQYKQGAGGYRRTSDGTITGEQYLSVPWANGDTYISKQAIYKAAYDIFVITPPTLAAAKAYKIGKLLDYASTYKRTGRVVFNGNTYDSGYSLHDKLHEDWHDFTADGDVPGGYYVRNYLNAEIPFTLANLSTLINIIQDLYFAVKVVSDDHTDKINALTTIPDVMAYDYTIGWMVLPYDRNLTFYAAYNLSIDATQSAGSPFATPVGGAAILGGFLDLAHNDVRYVDYNADFNADSQQVGTVKFVYKPNYSGTPATVQRLITICRANNDNRNLIQLTHNITTGTLEITILNGSSVAIVSGALGVWAPVAGTEYNFELHYDITTGNTWLKINTVQFGVTNTSVGTRTIDILLLRVGQNVNAAVPTNSNFKMKELYIYKV